MTAPFPTPPLWADARTMARLLCIGESTFREHVAAGTLPAPEILEDRPQWRTAAVDDALIALWEQEHGPRPRKAPPPEPRDPYMDRIRQVLQQPPTTNVYFASCHHWIKVGRAVNVDERLREMRSGNPHAIELIVEFPGTPALETAIHHALRHLRHRGEWFDRDPYIETIIKYLREHYG